MSKKFALRLIFMLTVLGVLLLFESCVALEAKPAIPTFTIQEISQPYDVPPTTTSIVDPYTGEEKIITYPGYAVENKTVYIVIKNQPFVPYKNDKGETMNLYYEYTARGHYIEGEGGGWSLPQPQYYEQSDLEYTLIPFKGLPSSGKVDVKVRALIGTLTERPRMPGLESSDGFYYRFEGIEGEYDTITVSSSDLIISTTLPSSSSPSNVSPSTTSNTPTTSGYHNPPIQNPWKTIVLITLVTVCIIVIPITIIVFQYGKRKTKILAVS